MVDTKKWQAFVTVAAVVKHSTDNKYLCVEEYAKSSGKLVVNQPAGHVEPNETLEQACQRETLEETGWHVKINQFLGIYTYQPFQEKTFYRFCFLATPVCFDETYHIDQDIERAVWYSLAELKNKENIRSPLVISCLEDAERGKSYPLSIVNELIITS